TDQDYWNMGAAFTAAYALSQLLSGRMMDMLGLRWGFALACAFWGIASMCHALVSTTVGFFVCRILLGFGEGGNFPAAIKATAEWFPKSERALATGLFNSGSNVGGILVPAGLPYVVALFSTVTIGSMVLGWRGAFIITALVDLSWIVAWLILYKTPEAHPRVSKAELAHINSEPPESPVKIPWRKLFPHRQTWAYAQAKFMTDCFWWFYLFGSPLFFAEKFNLDLKHRSGQIATIYILASVGSIAGGWLAGHFMKIGWPVHRARKTTMLICALCVVPVVFATVVTNPWVAVALITLAASAHQAWSANVFSLTGDMFPRRVVGSVTGFGGMLGALGGFALFACTGVIREKTGSYFIIFLAAALAYLISLLLVHLLTPKLEQARIE
ncbi:MAG TPA: MFS transporter, partial [Verrucomicrobiae bacterium]|nr:MFS transporter [Verrucomicrobiae bacterium]